MLRSKDFWWGVGLTLGGLYVYHHFVSPLPGAKRKGG
jgi:hypothetical protein